MRLGIFGSASDPQCQALQSVLARRGVEGVLVEAQGLNDGTPAAFDGDDFFFAGQRLSDVGCWYLRHVMSPLPPAFSDAGTYHLFADWYDQYMFRRERFGFQLSWLAWLVLRGVPVVNPPEHGMVVQLKPFQLAAARHVGLEIPPTLITNDPGRVAAFRRAVGEVVYKPSMGGGLCLPLDDAAMGRLDQITAAPVTFQARVRGDSIRATFVGDDLVSCAAIPTDALDYRDDQAYKAGQQQYTACELPPDVIDKCRALMRHCGLLFSGIDLIRRADGGFAFLEANSSPIYLDVERKMQVPITDALAGYMLRLANDPGGYRQRVAEADRPPRAFVDYAQPYNPQVGTRATVPAPVSPPPPPRAGTA